MRKVTRLRTVIGLCMAFAIALLVGFGCDNSDVSDDGTLVIKTCSHAITLQITPMGAGYGVTFMSIDTRDGSDCTAVGYGSILAADTLVTGISGVPKIGPGTLTLTYNDGNSEGTFPGKDFTVTINGVTGELITGGFVHISLKDADGNPISTFTPGLPVHMTLSGNTEAAPEGSQLAIYRVDDGKTFNDAVFEGFVIVKSKDGHKYVEYSASKGNATYIVVIAMPTGTGGSGGLPTT